jgi:dTDP-4-amino-4,6-dideoxygalactose transaminase
MNSRLDTIQAAILKEKLKIFPKELELRSQVAANYNVALESCCKVPQLSPEVTSSWAQYTIIVNDQKAIQSELKEQGIPSVIYYPIPLTQQLGYSNYPQVSSKTGVSEDLASSVLSLPMHPYLTSSSQSHVLEKLIPLLKKS